MTVPGPRAPVTRGDAVTVDVRVRPGASRTAVGGRYGDRLVVAVSARAVDGAATDAALRAVADAVGVRPRHVSLVTGHKSRDKVVAIHCADAAEAVRVRQAVDALM